MADRLTNRPSGTPKYSNKDELNQLRQKLENMNSLERTQARVESKLRGILIESGYLKKARIDGTTKDVLDAETEEEAINLVNDLVANFEYSLRNTPELFNELPKPFHFNTTLRQMLIWAHKDGNLYWDVDVVINGDDIKVAAPLRLVG